MATHHSFDASSLQAHFRGNDKDYVKHVFSTGQKKWEVWLVFPERQSFELKNSKIKKDMFKIRKLFMADYKEHKARYFMYLYN